MVDILQHLDVVTGELTMDLRCLVADPGERTGQNQRRAVDGGQLDPPHAMPPGKCTRVAAGWNVGAVVRVHVAEQAWIAGESSCRRDRCHRDAVTQVTARSPLLSDAALEQSTPEERT